MIERPQSEKNLSPFEHTIINDYYLSFHHSQGLSDLQRQILKYAFGEYLKEGLDLDSIDFKKLSKLGRKLKPPIQHKPYTKSDLVTQQLELDWFFQWIYNNRRRTNAYTNKHPKYQSPFEIDIETLLGEICENIVIRDLYYQDVPRFTSKIPDPHRSFLRHYGLNKKTIQSNSIRAIYSKLSDRLAFDVYQNNPSLSTLITDLKIAWEKNHPGELFWPKKTLSDIQRGPI
jgi:hypothetical protein